MKTNKEKKTLELVQSLYYFKIIFQVLLCAQKIIHLHIWVENIAADQIKNAKLEERSMK